MTPPQLCRAMGAWCVLTLLLPACSPALNWREVQLGGLRAMLPCKPDRAERRVVLGTQDVAMTMAGCEAAGALYAISHVQVGDVALVDSTQDAWRESMLAHFQTRMVQKAIYQLARPSIAAGLPASKPNPSPSPGLDILNVQGTGADGAPLQARLLWLAQGVDLYHVAIYAPGLKADQFDILFSELVLQ